MKKHLILCCGALVEIRGEHVSVLTDPIVSKCPMVESLYGYRNIDRNVVNEIVERKVKELGLFCCHRVFNSKLVIPYGASEIIIVCMQDNLFDAAVTVCDGAGTVITSSPALVQEIGARLTGIVKTSPVKEIKEYIERVGGIVLEPSSARIDQVGGLKKAIDLGFARIAVTIPGFNAEQIPKLRKLEDQAGADVTIFSVCNTCAVEDMLPFIEQADLVWAGASELVRARLGHRAIMQLGVGIPVFAMTGKGRRAICTYMAKHERKMVVFRSRLPYGTLERSPRLKKSASPLINRVKRCI